MRTALAIVPEEFVHTGYTVADHVCTVTLNRPERRNALNWRAYDELESAFLAIERDPDIRCVILTGADPAFCSGDDVGEIMAGGEGIARRDTPVSGNPPNAASMASRRSPAGALAPPGVISSQKKL